MGGELRSLSFIVELIDRATRPLQNIMGVAESLDRSTVEIGVEATGTETAIGSFGKLQGGLNKFSDVGGGKMGEQLQEAGGKVAEAGQKIKQVWDPASQSFIQVAQAANQAAQGVEKVTQKMGPLQAAATKVSGAIDDVKYKLLVIQASAGAFMYGAIGAAAEEERLGNITKATFGEGAEGILKWADEADKLLGTTRAGWRDGPGAEQQGRCILCDHAKELQHQRKYFPPQKREAFEEPTEGARRLAQPPEDSIRPEGKWPGGFNGPVDEIKAVA
ncbi:MAG: hypothetical protein ACYDHX_13955 [Methanothrix sp.]